MLWLIAVLFTLSVNAQGGFLSRLLETETDSGVSLQEYYGRISDSLDSEGDSQQAYVVVLLSYDRDETTLRLHFNMKEPGHDKFPETDFQWNTMLNLRQQVDATMVNVDKE